MSITAQIVDGKIQETASSDSLASSTTKSGSKMDKDAFLQLLVAQMKYQDPLEPTSNTEYIAQYATFSELEQMQNMSSSMDLSRASSLVGQTAIMKVTSSTGDISYVRGQVDYVEYENNKAYLSINGSLYSLDDLDSVVDPTYLEAYDKFTEWAAKLVNLPTVANLTLDEQEDVESLYDTYNDMTDYQKSFVSDTLKSSINSYHEKMEELLKIKAAADAAKGETEGTGSIEGTGETEGTGGTSGTES